MPAGATIFSGMRWRNEFHPATPTPSAPAWWPGAKRLGCLMSADRTMPPRRVPVLTEVVLLSEQEGVDIPIDPPPAQAPEPLQQPTQQTLPQRAEPAANAALSEGMDEQLIESVWADLQRQVDLMLEYRLRETLAPILSRATEAVIRESRQQLASTLRDVVARAVAQELSRHRGR